MRAWLIVWQRLMLGAVLVLNTISPSAVVAQTADPSDPLPADGPEVSLEARVPGTTGRASESLLNDDTPIASGDLQAEGVSATATRSSLSLNGSWAYVSIPYHGDLQPAGALTIEAWVRLSDNSGCRVVYANDNEAGIWFGLCGGRLRLRVAGVWTGDGETPIPADLWTHVAVTSAGGSRQYYINGEPDGHSSFTPVAPASTRSFAIGVNPAIPANWFSGNIAEVRLWNVARDRDQIRRTMHLALDERRPGLVANWQLSDNYRDSIGAHNGTPHGYANLSGPPAPPAPALVPIDANFSKLPEPRFGAATAYIPRLNRILLIGGHDASQELNRIDAVDASTGESQSLGALPAPSSAAAAAYVPTNDTVYLFDPAAIYAINPVTGAHRLVSASPNLPEKPASVYHPELDRIYLLGGGPPQNASSEVWVFTPQTEVLSGPLSTSLPSGRRLVGAAYSGITGNIYYFGGCELSCAPLPSHVTDTIFEITFQADGAIDAITQVQTAVLPRPSFGLAALEDPISGLIYLLGGSRWEGFPAVPSASEAILAFDPATRQIWPTPILLPGGWIESSIAYDSKGRQVLVLGGHSISDDETRADIWRVPLGDGPAVPLGWWDFPEPVGRKVTAIDGEDARVLVATSGDSAWRYESDGTRARYPAAVLGTATGNINDVAYSSANDHIWIATDDAGVKLDDGSAITTYGQAVLGTNQTTALDIAPTYSDPRYGPMIGTTDGLVRYGGVPFPAWRTSFAGEVIAGIARRGTRDFWVLANHRLKHLTTRVDGSASETGYGLPCNTLGNWADVALGANRDWWVVSPGRIEYVAEGICRIPAADEPGGGILDEPPIGNAGTAVDIDADGRTWISVLSEAEESGGLVAYEVISGVVRTDDFNWLSAPVAGRTQVSFGTEPLWDSGFTAVGAADERVWAGKESGELVTVAQRWQQLDESNRMDQKAVTGVWTTRGRAFMATDTDLHVLMPDGQTWDNRGGVQVHAVLGDRRGRIWVGTETDLRIYRSDGWDLLAAVKGRPPVGPVLALAEDQSGRIWIGGAGGLTLFDRERFVLTFKSVNSGLPSNTIKTLLVDRDNRLWAGTANGLARLEDSDWTVFTVADGLPDNAVHNLAQLGTGEIAVSTAAGLSLYDGNAFVAENPPGPVSNLPLTVDELGRLWAGGAVRTATGWQGHYLTNSGLRSSTISDNATDRADRVWFSHAPDGGVSVRGALLPPLADVVPIITGISPDHGSAGDIVTISGTGLDCGTSPPEITIGGAEAELVSSGGCAGSIEVELNANNGSGDVSIRVGGRRTTYAGNGRPAFCADPVITSFSPTGGNDGVTVDIRGTNFDPGATVFLGDGAPRVPGFVDPTHLVLSIKSSDGTGPVQVENACGSGHAAASSEEFRRIVLEISKIVPNQGMEAYGLRANRTTLFQHYLSYSIAKRPKDHLEIDRAEITFTDPDTGASYTHRVSETFSIKPGPGAPTEAMLRDIDYSLNAWIKPDMAGDAGGDWIMTSVLKRNGHLVASAEGPISFAANKPLRVLLVPFIREDHNSAAAVNTMRQDIYKGLGNLRERIMPTGRVEPVWSPLAVVKPEWIQLPLPGGGFQQVHYEVEIQSIQDLFWASYDLDRVRRWYNKNSDNDVQMVFGVVHTGMIKGDTAVGQAFWPDLTDVVNTLSLHHLDLACDLANFGVRVGSLGFLGSDDGCHLDIPLFVGWGGAAMAEPSYLIGHELGHMNGLVKPWASHHASDNITHSSSDELDGGECNDPGVSYNSDKTLYRQPNVTEPVVNILDRKQLYPNLNQGARQPAGTYRRAKAMMSYACEQWDENVFFEPADLPSIIFYAGDRIAGAPIEPFPNRLEQGTPAAGMPGSQQPVGPRLSVSGLITTTTSSGRITGVETLGPDASLAPSFATGYTLVQLDAAGTELAQLGVFPLFNTSETGPAGETGFFAATLARQEGVARIELRHDDVVLDTFIAGGGVPSVSITSPAGGSYDSGALAVTWTAEDPEGDDVQIAIEYSADGAATWIPVAFSTGSNTVEIPIGLLAGSPHARIRVTATDGLNEASATSEPFAVANQAPLPYIGHPEPGATFLEGKQIQLSGGADDPQDGALLGDHLRWQSDQDGALGIGSELLTHLSVGTHLLTLEAENSGGLQASTSVTVTVQGDYDHDGFADTEELADGLSPLTENDAHSDEDGDGLPLIVERKRGLDPTNPDSDGDGRSDSDEVASGTDPGLPDAPLPPDELSVHPPVLSIAADLSLDTLLPVQTVQVLSRAPLSWTVEADAAWLTASPDSGLTPSGVTVQPQAFRLGDGVYTATLTFTSDGSPTSASTTVRITVTNSQAHFDVNRDGRLDHLDVDEVADRVGAVLGHDEYSYRHDLDRDGDIDETDLQLIRDAVHRFTIYLPVVLRR